MKLYVFPLSPRAMKVIALAEHLQIEHETQLVDLTKGDQMKPEFTALNPNQRMPVLEDDGFVLWESNAILQYLASKKPAGAALWPSDPRRQAEVSRWMFWEACHWAPACGTLAFERVVKKLLGQGDADPAVALAQIAQYPVAGLTEIARWWEGFAALPGMKKALAPLQQR
jgi:glutathione S-transferase